MSNLATRFLTAVVFVAIMLAGIYYSPLSLFLLFLLINFGGFWEYQTLIDLYPINKHEKPRRERLGMSIVGSLVYALLVAAYLQWIPTPFMALILPIISGLFLKELFAPKSKSPFIRVALNLMGPVYIAVPCAFINVIANYHGIFEPNRLIGIFLVIWANDAAAYLVGRMIGKTPLFPRISPKKTWEGSIGGVLGGLAVAVAVPYVFPNDFGEYVWYGVAVTAILFGSLGDLVESMFKRSLNVKDSGNLLPGHGGILDRFDALFFAVPFIYTVVVVFG
ncbi:MAG: phosphatidate cytidylyltransferase [Chitinophagales bacterium]